MFNQFVLQPSYKIKASNCAMWPGNPFFTTVNTVLPSPLVPILVRFTPMFLGE